MSCSQPTEGFERNLQLSERISRHNGFVEIAVKSELLYILIRENEIQLDLCQIQLDFTFPENLTEFTEKVFTQPTRPNSKVKSFTWFLLSGDESEENINWEQFECPMSFSQCHYDWCATSDNSAMVNILFSKYNIYMI